MSNGNTGRPGGGQPPTGTTPPGQNGTPSGRVGNGSGNRPENRDDLAGSHAGTTRTAGAYGAGNGAVPPRTPPSANPVRSAPNGGQARTPSGPPRTQPSASPPPAQPPGGQRPAPVTTWAPKGRRLGVTQPGAAQTGAAGPPAGAPVPSPVAPNGRAGAPGQAPNAAAAAPQRTNGAPSADPRTRPDNGVPVWDPPPPLGSKQSWRERLGLGKKDPDPNAPYQRPVPGAAPAPNGAAPLPHRAAPPATGANGAMAAAPVAGAPRIQHQPPMQQPPGNQPLANPPSANPPRSAAPPAARTSGPAPSPQPDPATTTNRLTPPAADPQTFGLKPSGKAPLPGPPAPTAGPSTTGGGGSAPPLYRTPPPVSAPTQRVAPGAPGVAGAPGMPPTTGSTALGTAGAAGAAGAPTSAETTGPDVLATGKPKPGIARRTRKARLRLSRLDPWSVMKTSFLFSIAAGIMLVVATYAVWTVLSTSGLFPAINDIVASVVSTPGDTTPFRIEEYINTRKVLGVAALIACVDVVIFTALATLGSFLYNLAATVLGGLEITLAED